MTSTAAGTPALTAAERSDAAKPLGLEQWRVNPLRQLRRLVQGLPHVASHLFEKRLGRRGIGVCQPDRDLQIDRERDQVLLYTLV